MAVKLIDLQVLYGVAGAREKFERLVAKLIKAEHPQAETVRVKKGDDGIDVYLGKFSEPAGIDIFQCKYFPQGIGPAQQKQIRQSFTRVLNSTKFKARSWTLCLPLDLATDEQTWFDTWRAKHASKGVIIEAPWTALKLEGLLCLEKNRGLKEAYFKEEHLTQIRETHAMMQDLIVSLAKRLQEDAATRDEAKQTDVLTRQADEVARFVQSFRETYLGRLGQAAGDMGFPGKRPAHWEVVIRPSWIPAHPRINTIKECWEIVEACRVGSNGWQYPVVTRGEKQPGQDWAGITKVRDLEVESWRLAQKGIFAHMFPIWDDVEKLDEKPDLSGWDLPSGVVPQHFLDIDVAIRTFTHVFRFAAKLAERAFDPGDGTVQVSVRLNGTRDRAMIRWGEHRSLERCYQAAEPALANAWFCPRAELLAGPDAFARTAAAWFFERFGWHDESGEVVARVQNRIFFQQ
jgi:hypothetical protein